ncbi:MAG: type II secretion system F family protein [Clostridiales bacterium]|jgi:type IV pilus assembly protein PilC|nr:type II secretion system F family protein [Clostridiales bacterium]
MATLLYRGFNADGRRLCGARSFSSEAQMKEYLDKKGVVNYDIFTSTTVYKQGMYKSVSPKELSVLCKQMSVLFHSQITLMEGLSVLVEQSENKQLKQTLTEVYDFMDRGFSFSEAMGMYDHIFTSYLLSMVVIGETSGTLDTIFSRMSSYFDKEDKIRKKIRSAVTYPAILTVLMAAIIVLLIVKILPMFGDILDSMGAEMPSATSAILGAGSFLAGYGWIILLVIIAAAVGIFLYVRSEKGRVLFDRLKFRIPVYRFISSRIITSRFARSLAILFRSGVQLLNALQDITVLMDNRFLEEKLTKAVEKATVREEITGALQDIGVFPVLFLKMFSIGEKTGHLDEMLEKAASVFDDEVDDALERFTAMLEPALIIILSLIVGVILLSVVLPMITVMNAIG